MTLKHVATPADEGAAAPVAGEAAGGNPGGIDETGGDHGGDDIGGDADTEVDEIEVLPWWRNPWNMVALVIGALGLAGIVGYAIGEARATPDPSAVDIGFLQDMRTHHEQAVAMGNIYLSKSGTDPNLSIIAQEIVVDQSVDVGRMIQLLRLYGEPEANMTDTAMAWMGQPTPSERMPGMATDSDLDALSKAQGAEADQTFAKLMIAHHEGGIHMAQYAADHAAEKEVRDFAKAMVSGQQSENYELQTFLDSQ